MSKYAELVAEKLANNPLASVIGEQLTKLADTLGEIAPKVNSSADPNAPKKPTIGTILAEAKESAVHNSEVFAKLEKWNAIREQSKVAYQELLVILHPEFDGVSVESDSDDAERQALITEAKEVYNKIKAGLNFLSSQDSVDKNFANDFLSSIPVVEGARQRTSISDSSTLRPRFSVIDITGPDNFSITATTFTDVVKILANTDCKVTTSDLSDSWQKAGGNAETDSGTRIEFSIDEFNFVTVKK